MSEPGLSLQFRVFRIAKGGHSAAEYEDACAGDPEHGRFAIADGASESLFAARWAQLLVDGFVQTGPGPVGSWSWLTPLQRRWADSLTPQPLPWYAEIKVELGAFATFLGVTMQPKRSGRRRQAWQAFAIGDSCLFQVRQGRLHQAFPLTRSQDFGNSPWLIGSRRLLQGKELRERQVRAKGTWKKDDRFWLMTDALAQWFLQEVEAGRQPWQTPELLLTCAQADQDFAAWIDGLRITQALRNDDVTLAGVFQESAAG